MSDEGNIIKECINCKKKFCGRSDKKYCSDYCRTSYNNHLYRVRRAEILKVQKILLKNHEILKRLYLHKRIKMSENELLSLGFNENYFTALPQGFPLKRGEIIMQCFDFIVHIDKKHNVSIHKSE